MSAPEQQKAKQKKPSKPYPSFPLTAHNNGQWCKKIRGKIHFFGVWIDPEAAHQRYLREGADLHAGREPRPETLSPGAATVKDVCNQYLTYLFRRSEDDEISHRWFEDCRSVLKDFAAFMGSGRSVYDLAPDDFERYRGKLTRKGVAGRVGLGVHALNRAITVVRGALKYAYEMDLISSPVKYGKSFARPSATLKRKSKSTKELAHGKRVFDVAGVRALLNAADPSLRAMILLGVNGGLGNTDCARLPVSSIDWESCLIRYDRPKTGVERTVPLWPETLAALRTCLEKRPHPASEAHAGLVFLTVSGKPWIRDHVHQSQDGAIENVITTDSVASQFQKLLGELNLKRKGIGFYALRHTFRTWADETKDQHAIHRIMGHAIPGMSGVSIEEISLERLRAVVDHVRTKVFPPAGNRALSPSQELHGDAATRGP